MHTMCRKRRKHKKYKKQHTCAFGVFVARSSWSLTNALLPSTRPAQNDGTLWRFSGIVLKNLCAHGTYSRMEVWNAWLAGWGWQNLEAVHRPAASRNSDAEWVFRTTHRIGSTRRPTRCIGKAKANHTFYEICTGDATTGIDTRQMRRHTPGENTRESLCHSSTDWEWV